MPDAVRDPALPEARAVQDAPASEVERIAEVYVSGALGDLHKALLTAVADGMAVASQVSRGFVRWGQPERRR